MEDPKRGPTITTIGILIWCILCNLNFQGVYPNENHIYPVYSLTSRKSKLLPSQESCSKYIKSNCHLSKTPKYSHPKELLETRLIHVTFLWDFQHIRFEKFSPSGVG